MPELPGGRDALRGTKRVAVPGCYPTAASLAMAPALAAGLVEPDVVVVAASGTSGAGKSPKVNLLGSEVMGSASAYGVGGVHRHTPEMVQNLSAAAGHAGHRVVHPGAGADVPRHPGHRQRAGRAPASASTTSGPSTRRPTATSLSSTCCRRGSGRPRRRRSARTPCCCRWRVDEAAGRVVVVAALDNLTKGTAGAAVQCLNLALGLPETTGLPTVGVAP